MSFGIPDLITAAVIKDKLKELKADPAKLSFILCPFTDIPEIKDQVGGEYIDQAMQFVLDNRIHVGPYFSLDEKKLPAVDVIYRTTESQKYLGDYGDDIPNTSFKSRLDPRVYHTFNVSKVNKSTLEAPAAAGLKDKLWRNLVVTNGDQTGVIRGIYDTEDGTTVICLEEDIDPNTSYTDWRAQSSDRAKGIIVNSSTDQTDVTIQLTTSGDFAIHRLLATVIRYCIKSGRLTFDRLGLQEITMSQGAPSVREDDQMIFDTQFAISGKMTDHWVDRFYDLTDPTDPVELGFTAQSKGREDVELD